MAIDYQAAQKSFRKHKANLTRAKNSGDPHKVVAAVDKAFGEWDDMGIPYPDSWHTWNVAKQDAQHEIHRQGLFTDRRNDPLENTPEKANARFREDKGMVGGYGVSRSLSQDVDKMKKLRVRNAQKPGVRGV